MQYFRPGSVEESLRHMTEFGCSVLAGGTDVFPQQDGGAPRRPLLDLSAVAELRGISQTGGEWRIGAMTSWANIANSKMPAAFRALQQAARQIGSVQIQNTASIGGNLCNASPAADGVPPLLALDAQVELSGVGGSRVLPLEQFILGNRRTALKPDELLTAIIVPGDAVCGQSHFVKLGARRYLVISILMVACRLEIDAAGRVASVAIAVGACSEVAQRLRELEADILDRHADALGQLVVADGHLSSLSPIDDIRGSAAYRKDSVKAVVHRAILACLPTPVESANGGQNG